MSETILLVAGCMVFATAAVATLLYGYMALNRAWMADDGANVGVPIPGAVPLAAVPIPVLSPD